jgi:hypothetical protein
MNIWKTIVGLIVTSVLSVSVCAQSATCEEQLNSAAAEFAAGRFYGIPAMLKPCIDKGFTREQRQRAYLLLTQTYILLEDPIAAEDSYLKVLKANPEYETDPATDPIDVVYLSKKFTAAPIFSVYANAGGNVSIVRVIHEVYPSSGSVPIKTEYTLRPGWQVTAGAEWTFSNHVSLCGELSLSQTSYKKNQNFGFERDQLEFVDRQTWLSIPISVRYSDNAGKFRPYGFLGYSVNFLIQDKGEVLDQNNDLNPDQSGNILTKTAQSATLNFNDQRNRLNYSFFIGSGVKYKWKLDFIYAELRYSFGMKNVVKGENIFSSEAFQRYGMVDDYFRLDNLSLSVGYVRPLYKPRKLKKARTKGLLRFIKRAGDEGAN